MEALTVAGGRALPLERWPPESNPTLRAWDAADELLLDWLEGAADTGPDFPPSPPAARVGETLVVGDTFGAVTLGLLAGRGDEAGELRVYADSVLTGEAIRRNALRCDLGVDGWRILDPGGLADLAPGSLKRVLVKVPKSLGALEDLLHRVRPALAAGGVVVCAGMTRTIHRSTLELPAALVGPTVSSHARRKARLVLARFDPDLEPPANPWPKRWSAFGIRTTNHAGVFSAESLDAGAAVLLDTLPVLLRDLPPGARDAVDLGCGNGILGAAVARERPGLDLEFRDASWAALRSAEATFAEAAPGGVARFTAADAMDGRADASVDLVVCNPPFHARGARGDDTAWRMFTGARRTLRRGGQLWVVGNRHLGYAAKLNRLFGNAEVVTGHPKFVVVRATR